MNEDRSGRTRDEIDDEAKHLCAEGTVRLREIADWISAIAQKGGGISLLELQLLHARLTGIYDLIGGQTAFEMDNVETYSDGTPVPIAVGPPNSRGWSESGDVCDCGIPWLPVTAVNDGYDSDGPIPVACEVMFVDPPHRRMSSMRAACQEAYRDPGALKASLREVKR